VEAELEEELLDISDDDIIEELDDRKNNKK